MSFDHLWFSCLLDTADEQRFQPLFALAEKQTVITPEIEETLRYWQEFPERFSTRWSDSVSIEERKQHGEWYNRFVWAFNLPAYTDLGEEVAGFLSEETCFRYISISRCSPGAILWHAIGHERGLALPGTMGNMFFSAQHVAIALAQTDNAMKGLELGEAIQRGLELAGHSNDETDIIDVITHIPEGLRRAQEERKGFMAIARPQL